MSAPTLADIKNQSRALQERDEPRGAPPARGRLGAGNLTASVLLLSLGTFLRCPARHTFRASGFLLFGFYWATQAMNLYAKEEGDFVNTIFAAVAAYFFSYFAYHSLLDRATGKESASVRWLASTSGITAGVYFVTSLVQPVAEWLVLTVAAQTEAFLTFFGQGGIRGGGSPEGSLVALVIIAFIVFRILPELYDAIIGLLDLTRRPGPIEAWMREHKVFGRRTTRPFHPGGTGPSVVSAAPVATVEADVAAQQVSAPSLTRES